MYLKFRFILVLLCLFPVMAQTAGRTIEISQAKIRHVPANLKVTAAYLVMHNRSDKDAVLTSLQSPVADRVEIHESLMKDGMASMVKKENLQIPPHGRVELTPGGLHIMLLGLKKPIKTDELIPIEFSFENGTKLIVPIKVMDMRKTQPHHSHETHQHNHKHHQH